MHRSTRLVQATAIAAGLFVSAGLASAQTAATPSPSPTKWVNPVRGEANLGYLKPKTSVKADLVVTIIEVKNLSTSPIAGLKIEEFWYDKTGNPVTGGIARLRNAAGQPRLLQPDEVVTLTIETPKKPDMNSNKYVFSHANGTVKGKLLTTMKDPAGATTTK